MKTGILLAMLLIAAFASASDTMDHVGGMAEVEDAMTTVTATPEVISNSSGASVKIEEPKTETVSEPEEVTEIKKEIAEETEIEEKEEIETPEMTATSGTSSETSDIGSCDIESSVGDGYTELTAKCELELPTPCHSVSYSWLPSREKNHYIFTIWVKQMPTACIQTIKETTITDSLKLETTEEVTADYKIHYEKARAASEKPVTTIRERIRERVQTRELPPASL